MYQEKSENTPYQEVVKPGVDTESIRYKAGMPFKDETDPLAKRLNNLAGALIGLAEWAEQAARRNAENRQARYASGDLDRRTRYERRYNSSPRPVPAYREQPLRHPAIQEEKLPLPVPPELPDDLAPAGIYQPGLEVHDEPTQGLIKVIVELAAFDVENQLQIEVHHDILIIQGECPDYRLNVESLLPAPVHPEPLSRSYQNGFLELQFRRA